MPHPLVLNDSFPPGRNEPCFCGSTRRFKQCCGSLSADRSPPHGIGIVEDFLGPAERAKLAGLAATLEGKPFMVLDRANNLTPTLDDTRVCEWVAFGESQRLIDEVVARAFEEQIIPRIGQSIDWYEQPQVLRYGPGGYYKH